MGEVYTGADKLQAYLEHHGILGMKWGVRRYQRADGSLTPEGKKHLNRKEKKELKRAFKEEQSRQKTYIKQLKRGIILDSKVKSGQAIVDQDPMTGKVRPDEHGRYKIVEATTERDKKVYEESARMGIKELEKYSKSENPKIAKLASKNLKLAKKWFADANKQTRREAATAAVGLVTTTGLGLLASYGIGNLVGAIAFKHDDISDDNYLAHHGILGMKWGVRRYEPYPSGHKGGKEIGEAAKKTKRKLTYKDAKKVARRVEDYSDEEIEDLVKQLRNRNKILDEVSRETERKRRAVAFYTGTVKAVSGTLKDGSAIYGNITGVGTKKK